MQGRQASKALEGRTEMEGSPAPLARLRWFSGTGNTARAADLISGELEEAGYRSENLAMERGRQASPEQAALEVILFPVHATAVPQIVRQYLVKLPPGNGTQRVSTESTWLTYKEGVGYWELIELYVK
jgi:hypothetical protein